MKSKQLDSVFLKQFREYCVVYGFRGEKKYGDIAFKQFPGTNREYHFIRQLLYDMLSRVAVPAKIANEVQKLDVPTVNQLFSFTTKLQSILSGYCRNEPLTTCYFKPFILALREFLPEIKRYKFILTSESLKELSVTDHYTTDENHIDDKALEEIVYNVYRFLNHLNRYLDHFSKLLKQESVMSKGLAVTTQVEQYLLQLVALIENNITAATDTCVKLEEWLKHLDMLEFQELYN